MIKQKITSTPFANSQKVYVEGTLFPIRVAMRKISLSPTKLSNGETEVNPPVFVYDTSGPYTDEKVEVDIHKGLPRLREQWILDRNDVDVLSGITSSYGQERLADDKLDALRFDCLHQPKVAIEGRSEEHTSELQSRFDLVCRLLL